MFQTQTIGVESYLPLAGLSSEEPLQLSDVEMGDSRRGGYLGNSLSNLPLTHTEVKMCGSRRGHHSGTSLSDLSLLHPEAVIASSQDLGWHNIRVLQMRQADSRMKVLPLENHCLIFQWTLPGSTEGIVSETRFGIPGLASEATYVSGDHRYALGIGTYTIFGFQSKLKDPTQLGPFATFFDTRVASNDLAVGGSVRIYPKLSVGGSFIYGRGFVDIALPNPQLAPLGIARQDRLDVSAFGAPGASIGLHFRPTQKISFGINYKTRRNYDLEGSLATFVAVPGTGGSQIVSIKPQVVVKLKPPAVAEGGVEIKATNKLHLFADFRYYDYAATFQEIDVNDKQSSQLLFAMHLNAFDVRSVRAGGIYTVSDATKLHFGWAYTSNGLPDTAITPGTLNLGGFDISGGIGKRVWGYWLNVSVAGVLGLNRTIGVAENPAFAGRCGGRGAMLGLGLRW